jgi:dUTPase
MTTVAIQVLPHGEGLILPEYETRNSAGMDLMAAIPEGEELILAPRKRLMVPTGFAMALADGFEAQVRPRSGLAWKNGVTPTIVATNAFGMGIDRIALLLHQISDIRLLSENNVRFLEQFKSAL